MNKYKRLMVLSFFLAFLFINVRSVNAFSKMNRIYGNNRYDTSVSVSEKNFTASDNVVIASGQSYADSLCAAPLAKKLNAPIILVQKNLNEKAKNEILRLKAKNAYIIGGNGVVSTSVETELKAKGLNISRISGVDRFGTSIEVAKKLNSFNKAFVVLGTNFPDAISVAPVASKDGTPIILTKKDSVPTIVKNYLKGKSITKSYVIGGPQVIKAEGINGISNVERIYGSDRYETNFKIVEKFSQSTLNSIYFASGKDFPDALVASAIAGKQGLPIVLVGDSVNLNMKQFLKGKLGATAGINVLGGEKVLSTALVNSIFTDNSKNDNGSKGNSENMDKASKKIKVCIDAAHGGNDKLSPIGSKGTKEEVVNLSLALKVGRILSDKGLEVFYTRTQDIYLSDSERVSKAKSEGCQLFISIRCNSYTSSSANGIETYYLQGNSSSEKLAKNIHEKIASGVDLKDRGYKPDAIHHILKDVNCPSALIFFGFITNPEDEAKISSSYFQETAAYAIAGGIINYVNSNSNNDDSKVTPTPNPNPSETVVCIDPGHGGYDPGAIGPSGVREKDITLKVALKVGQKLADKGVKVVYTRTSDTVSWPSDVSQDLRKRVDIASNAGSDYYISIHCNSATAAAYGIETYYCNINNSGGKSALLAKNVQDELKKIANYNRGVKTANWYVNKYAKCPSILTEIGFISNAKEEKFLQSSDGQEKIAELIANGILKTMGK
ncbi:N-acetylmuramoyl-L-alanine amidase [Haloimpatiens sp. FM7315]|uniref:N-acetylmuramoyl-L-alanine amidase n=1 Tax=Haloimpatiens sp. FM7315 TaxID=3298609 RepID=UPI003709E7A4